MRQIKTHNEVKGSAVISWFVGLSGCNKEHEGIQEKALQTSTTQKKELPELSRFNHPSDFPGTHRPLRSAKQLAVRPW